MISLFRNRDHLWRCPLSRRYYDPRVLMRSLCAVTPLTVDRVRDLLALDRVGPTGRGFSEEQVENAYEAFLKWYEGKDKTGQSSPTPAPSTGAPVG